MEVKVQFYDEAERFISRSGKHNLCSIKEITLESEDYYVQLDERASKEIASFELAKHIIDRLGYYEIKDIPFSDKRLFTYHIALLTEKEKLKLIKEIEALKETIKTYNLSYTSNNIVELIKAEARSWKDLYNTQLNKSLWTLIKERIF